MRRLLLAVLLASAALHTFAAEYAFDYRNPQAWAGKPALAVGDQVSLTLAEDLAFTLRIVSAPPAGIAGQSFIANVEGVGASAILKATKKGLRVTIDDFEHSKLYTATYRDGEVKVKVDDTSSSGPEECGTCGEAIELPTTEATETAPVTAKRKLLATSGNEFPLASHKSVVDILVAFDKGAKAWAENKSNWGNGGDSIEEFADYAVNKMNTVLEKSDLLDTFCYRLVGVTEIDDQWDTIKESNLLEKLRSRSGALAKLNKLREKYGADTITLLIDRDRNKSGTSGQGYEYASSFTSASFDNSNYACNVCDIKTVYERYTMSHETGHNMGCGHSDKYDNQKHGRFDYSHGYNFTDATGEKRYTIMAYDRTAADSGYKPIPYFSNSNKTFYASDEDTKGCPLGEEGVNNNCKTLLDTCVDIAGLREHVKPYDWDVRFVDDNGNDIPDGSYFSSYYYVTMTHADSNATIYYTYDGSTPTLSSEYCAPGKRFTMSGTKTITACAVVNGEAQSVRTIKFNEGLEWSGDSNGDGLWLSGDSSVKPWSGEYFYNGDNVRFPDLPESSEAKVTVKGSVTPGTVDFAAAETKYIFDKGDDGALITISNASFEPTGSLTFNLPVQLSASSFTTPANQVVEFNAQFGADVSGTEVTYNPSTPIVVGAASTLKVAPGNGKTQTFVKFNNTGTYWSTSKFIVGEGTVRFTGTNNGGRGLFGSLQLEVGDGGNLVFDNGDVTGYSVDNSSLTIGQGGTVTFKTRDSLRRTVNFAGGSMLLTGASSGRGLDLMNGLTLNVTSDSSLDCDTSSDANAKYVYMRGGNPSFVFSNGAKLSNNVVYVGNNTSTGGIKLSGEGTFVQNGFGDEALTYKGTTEIGGGVTLELNTEHQNAGNYTVASGARLMGTGSITGNGTINLSASGAKLCGSLAIKNLSCADGAKLGDQWNPVSATITGSLAANNGATVSVTNGCLTIGENCDVTGFATGKLDIQNAELKLGTSLSVAGLTVNKSTLTLGNGAQLAITGTTSADCSKLKIVLENPAEEGIIPMLTANGGFVNINQLEVSPAGYKAVLGDSITQLCYEYDPNYVAYQTRLPVVDVLVAYDEGAVQYMGNRSLEEFAQDQIRKMNEVLATNKLDSHYSYRLAGVCKVAGTYTNIDTAPALVAEGEGAAVTLRAMRELYGADTVTLLVNTSGATLGNSSPLTSSTDVAGCHDDAFSVCSIVAVDTGSQHTMIHENAHNMGCGHSRKQDQANSPFEYGRGYYFDDNGTKRHTIMAYDVDGTGVYAYPSPYFSTSSDEFGFELGDADNDNARVLRETCRKVATWRESVKPHDDEVIITDENGNRLVSGCVFKDEIKVTVTAPVEGAELYYTLGGEDPVVEEDAWHQTYSCTFTFTQDRTLKVAYLVGNTLSPVQTVKFFKRANIPAEGLWQTGLKYPWVDDGEAIRSHNYTAYTSNIKKCTTPLMVKVNGPKRMSFEHKSYFMGESLSNGSNYSHIDILVDGTAQFTATECNTEWTKSHVDIPEGEHEVAFVYSQRNAMNNSGDYKDGTPEMDDAWWIKNIAFGEIPKIECAHGSSDNPVVWTFPSDATLIEEGMSGIVLGNSGITETFDFDSVNAVSLSVLATLPEGEEGEIAGCKIYRSSKNAYFYAFAYSNGDGTISLGFDTTTNYVTSASIPNWTGLHIWTFAFGAQTGAKLYCDGVEVPCTSEDSNKDSSKIQWVGTVISGPVTFGDDPRGEWAINGAKIYAVYSGLGTGEAIFEQAENAAENIVGLFDDVLSDYLEESIETKLALLKIYQETGSLTGSIAESAVLRISEIMPKPTDDQDPGLREGMDVNGLESGWVEVENTSNDKWADLADYRFIRVNRGKKTDPAGFGNFPSVLIPPKSRFVFYTSERYSNSKDKAVSAFEHGTFDGKPMIMGDELGGILVWGDKVNPKKSPFVRLYYMPDAATTNVVDTVVIPSDLPEGWSIIVGQAEEDEGTRRWMCPTPTRNAKNSDTDGLKRIGPNVGPLYENKEVKKGKETIGTKHESANEFARVAPPAKPGEDYEITFSFNPVMSPTEAAGFRDEDALAAITLVYRAGLDGEEQEVSVDLESDTFDQVDWGHTYKVKIPADKLPGAGQLVQWKFKATDASGDEWTSPSFNNPDDGYEWYGTIVEPSDDQLSKNLPTWHMFASGNHLSQMDVDKDKQDLSKVPNYARIAIYDSSTSNYYDYVRIDLRGNTSAGFTKKGHGLRFAKAHPLTMTDVVTGEQIKEIRKTSLISEFADPSYMRQMIAFWLWRKMGNLVPFDFPVRCNLNGEFYQLAFNSERFTDELIEDVYGLDKFGYGYKNVGWLESDSSTTAGGIEKKTPDDENEKDLRVLTSELTNHLKNLHDDDLTKFVVEKFDLPAWLNYLASARITQEMDDVWANLCIYYDNPDMNEGARGTDTWMPLGYDFNLSFGQWYYNDSNNLVSRFGLMSNQDWYKSHPLYGGRTIRAYRCEAHYNANYNPMNGNYGFEAVLQSSKFRRLFLRRLRTLMDQELKAPGTPEGATPFMFMMRKMASIMQADAALDQAKWPNDSSDSAIDVWTTRPADMNAGIDDIWNNYVVPRRQHLYVTHSITNTAKEIGYGSNLNAGIPNAQSPFADLIGQITVDYSQLANGVVVINNGNDEVVDMSGWTLKTGTGKKEVWTLPAGTVCDANDCIYVVSDRRQYIADYDGKLTDQVIIGNAVFGSAIPDSPLTYPATETSSGTMSINEEPVTFTADDKDAANAWVESLTPQLTQEQKNDGLSTDHFIIVAELVEGEAGKYKAVVDVNPATVEKPAVDTSSAEPMEIEDDTEDPDKKQVSVSISNATPGLWYGYEVSTSLGDDQNFQNDVGSFKRATSAAHKVTGSPRDKTETSAFFRVKVLPAKPTE